MLYESHVSCLLIHVRHFLGYDSKLYWNNGQIRFSYSGEKCDDKNNYTLNVILHCDYSETKNDFLGVFHYDDQCEVNIIFRTPKACMKIPLNVQNAKLFAKTSTNKSINLSPLKSSNHQATSSKGTFVIGFPIMYGHDLLCEAGSSVCFVASEETDMSKKFKNLGIMTSDLKLDKNENPILQLTSNEKCNEKTKVSSKIIFVCDELVGDGTPVYKDTLDCVINFVWKTKYACKEEKPCLLSAPNGQLYDFSTLIGTQYKAVYPNKTDNGDIYFSICSPSKECGDNKWGSCIIKTSEGGSKQTTNAGNFNTTLQMENKNLFLKYEGGSKCKTNGQLFSTTIEFIVADDAKDEVAVLVEDDCQIVLQFKTLLASQNVKNCVVKDDNDNEINLQPLIDFNSNYIATVNEKALPNETSAQNVQYLMNVCRPLNSIYSLNCHGNTASCRTVIKENKHEEELSLGHFEYSMNVEKGRVEGTTDVVMKYFHGSKCPSDPTEDMSTRVTFYCDEKAGLGNPVLQSIVECDYIFEFATNILCNDQALKMKNNSCILSNEKADASIDLKAFEVFKNNKYDVDICDNTPKTYTLVYKQSMIKIEYRGGEKGKIIFFHTKFNYLIIILTL